MTNDTFNKVEFDANWAASEKIYDDRRAVANAKLYRRCIASYYRTGGTDFPDTERTKHFVVERDSKAERSDFLTYISLYNRNGMMIAVYRSTNRGELKRLRRWPKSIDAGTAQTYAEFRKMIDECQKAVDEMQARNRAKRRLAADDSALEEGLSSVDMRDLEATMAEMESMFVDLPESFIH